MDTSVVRIMDLLQMTSGLLSSVGAWATSNALAVGVTAIAAAVVARALGSRWGILLVAAGAAFAGTLALWQYQATGTFLIPALVMAAGLAITVLIGWILRGAPMVGAVALFAGGWYLVLFAFLGPFAGTSMLGDLALGGLIMGSALIVHHVARVVGNRRQAQMRALAEAQAQSQNQSMSM